MGDKFLLYEKDLFQEGEEQRAIRIARIRKGGRGRQLFRTASKCISPVSGVEGTSQGKRGLRTLRSYAREGEGRGGLTLFKH